MNKKSKHLADLLPCDVIAKYFRGKDDNENLATYYVLDKDNISFYTTIYPALLIAMGKNYRLPDYIVSSATVNELLEIFDSDTLRFYFLYRGP